MEPEERMQGPELIWELSIADEIAKGAKIEFVSLGTDDETSTEVLGWYVLIRRPDNTARLLIKRFAFEPRLIKTIRGVMGLMDNHAPAAPMLYLPRLPQIRSESEIWKMVKS